MVADGVTVRFEPATDASPATTLGVADRIGTPGDITPSRPVGRGRQLGDLIVITPGPAG